MRCQRLDIIGFDIKAVEIPTESDMYNPKIRVTLSICEGQKWEVQVEIKLENLQNTGISVLEGLACVFLYMKVT